MIFTHDVFVAYAGPDRDVAVELVRELQARRVSVCWDGVLKAEDFFDTAIPAMLAACRVFAVLVSSHTWNGQHYTSDELAVAIQHARHSHMVIVPVWISDMAVENRPYGIATKVGISLPQSKDCLAVSRVDWSKSSSELSSKPPTADCDRSRRQQSRSE